MKIILLWRMFCELMRVFLGVWVKCFIYVCHVPLICDLALFFSLLAFRLDDLYFAMSKVLKSPTITVLRLIYGFTTSNICFVKLSASVLGVCMFRIVVFSP